MINIDISDPEVDVKELFYDFYKTMEVYNTDIGLSIYNVINWVDHHNVKGKLKADNSNVKDVVKLMKAWSLVGLIRIRPNMWYPQRESWYFDPI